MKLPFTKMHGAGNDFVMVAGTDLMADGLDGETIAALCDRRRGIGADGLIVVSPDRTLDFSMAYFNADGGEAPMCGNGARCAVAFAHRLGFVDGPCRFATGAGEHAGVFEGGMVRVDLPGWRDLRMNILNVAGDGLSLPAHFVDTGVPHLVVPVADVSTINVDREGPRLRCAPELGSDGANVNWIASTPVDGAYPIRTYERGVEAETLACGTGACAGAVILLELGLARSPVRLRTLGGDQLEVQPDHSGDGVSLHLRGPAAVAFHGEVQIDE